MIRSLLLFSALLVTLSACASAPPDQPHPYEGYLKQNGLKLPDPESFDHCRGYGCAARDRVSLSKKEWSRITQNFKNIKSPEAERKAVARTIATLETIVGEKTGTAGDVAGTFGQVGTHQLDCVDESINTTIYLAMLEQKNLLRHHVISSPTTRTPFTGMANGRFWPHRTAVMFERKSGTGYAVDSWYRDNGNPADIIALNEWIYGWAPQ